jgi:ribosomal protein S18 acetylase RimI-like enzyme
MRIPATPTAPAPSHDGPARAMTRALVALAVLADGGRSDTDSSGIVRVVVPVPVAGMSGLVVTESVVDLTRLRALTDDFVDRGAPWSISVVGPVPDAVVEVAADLGLLRHDEPTLVAPLAHARDDLTLVEEYRRAESDEDRATFGSLCDTAFGLPEGATTVLITPELVTEPSIRAFLAIRDGEPVGTALTVLDPHGWLSVYLVATATHARRLGVAERLMRFVLADGSARGAHTAQLQSSDMARPVYERLGFRDAHDDMVFFSTRADTARDS